MDKLIEQVAEAMWRSRFHREYGPDTEPFSAWSEIDDRYRNPIREEARVAVLAVRRWDVAHGPSKEGRAEFIQALESFSRDAWHYGEGGMDETEYLAARYEVERLAGFPEEE